MGKDMSRHKVSRRLSQVGLKTRSPVVKPLIRKHKGVKLVFAEEHVTWTDDNWSKTHFSNESKFYLVGSEGHQYVRRRTEDRLLSKFVKKSVKFGGRSVMV